MTKCALPLLLLCLSVPACNEAQSQTVSDDGELVPATVTVALAAESDISATIDLPGRLEPFYTTELSARVMGVVEELNVDVGDTFDEGDALAKLAVPDLERRLELVDARGAESAAESRIHAVALAAAEARVERLEKVAESGEGFVSAQRLDDAKAEVDAADARRSHVQAKVTTAEAGAAELDTLLSFATINAPFGGVVTRRYLSPGALARPGTPIFEVAQTDTLRAIAAIPERDALGLETGAKVTLSFPGTSVAPIEAELTRLGGVVDKRTQAVLAEAHIEEQEFVRAGSYARFHLTLKAREGTTVVPAEALHVGPGKGQLYVLREEQCVVVSVTTGADDGTRVEVLEGLDVGDQVVVATRDTLSDKRPCKVAE